MSEDMLHHIIRWNMLFFWRLVRLGRSDVDATQGAFLEPVDALLGGLVCHITVVYYKQNTLISYALFGKGGSSSSARASS